MQTSEIVSVRTRGEPVFIEIYEEQCQKSCVCPRRAVLSKLIQSNALELSADVIRSDDWKPLLQALRLDHSLTKIALSLSFLQNYPAVVADVARLQLIRSVQKDIHIPPILTPDTFNEFCSCLCEHLKNNNLLKTLSLQGFPFTISQLQQLANAIHRSKSVTYLSFDGCPFSRQHVEAICHALRGSWKPKVLSLNNCQIDNSSAEPLASLLQLQAIQLHGKAEKDSSHALGRIQGLQRLSICHNPLTDDGVVTIVSSLKDESGLRALDLQNCSIGNSGANAVLDILNGKCALEVVDLRRNPQIDSSLLRVVDAQIKKSNRGKKCKFRLLPLQKTSFVTVPHSRLRSRSVGCTDQRSIKQNHLRSQSEERNFRPVCSKRMKPTDLSSTKFGTTEARKSFQQKAENLYGFKSGGELKLESKLLACQENLKQEREMRLHSEKMLMEMFQENRQLREASKASVPDGYVLVESGLLDAVESTFVKFYQFLGIIKNKSVPLRHRHEVPTREHEEHQQLSLHEPGARQTATGTIPKATQSNNTSSSSDVTMQNAHTENGSVHERTKIPWGPVSSTPAIHNGLPTTASRNVPLALTAKKHSSIDASLLQDFISEKAQKLVSELQSKWNKSGSDRSSMSSIKHLSDQPRHRDSVPKVSSSQSSTKQRRDVQEKSAADAAGVQNGSLSAASVSLSLKEDSKRLSELLNIVQIPSKLAPSLDTSQVFYPLESDSAGYKSDDFVSTRSTSPASRDANRKHSLSGRKSRESSASSTSRPSVSKQSKHSSGAPSGDSKAGSGVIKEKVNRLSTVQKSSQNTSVISSLSEEVASARTTHSSQQNPSMNIPVTTLTSGTAESCKEQSLRGVVRSMPSLEAAEPRKVQHASKADATLTPSVSISRGVSGSFDIPTADITVSSIDSISKHFSENFFNKQPYNRNLSTPLSVARHDRHAMEGSDTVRTPSDITLSRNNSSISTPSSPDTLTSPRLVGSDFDDF